MSKGLKQRAVKKEVECPREETGRKIMKVKKYIKKIYKAKCENQRKAERERRG